MRPSGAANEAVHPPRSRKTSLVGDRRPSLPSTQPTSFFLAREEDVFGSLPKAASRRSSSSHKSSEAKQPLDNSGLGLGSDGKAVQQDSMYGVQSLEEALGQAFDQDEKEGETEKGGLGIGGFLKRKRGKEAGDKVTTHEDDKHTSPQHHGPASPAALRSSRANTMSQPLTPLQLESPIPESAIPSTPKSGSFRSLALSDEDDEAASQAITSAGEDEEDEEDAATGSMADARDSAPQLVMPSLAMPSRRPFTERGKQMGRLKIAVVGASGVGKTSLIRAIVRQCEDIVHLDPITTATPSFQTPRPGGKRSVRKSSARSHITEIQASTKAYPSWWSDVEDSRVLRRRKSVSETVLERNICFVDAPGLESAGKIEVEKQPLVRYLDSLFQKNAAMTGMGSAEVLGVLSGAGGVQVDVVLYICEQADSISQHDFEYMGKLAKYASVIPIISKADASPEAELAKRKTAIAQELPRCNINATVLNKPQPENAFDERAQTLMPSQEPSRSTCLGVSAPQAPFLVSCLLGSDDGEMDASLLMSPSYSPPLLSSELQALVTMLFDPETMAKLRHISARKFLQWRERIGLDVESTAADSTALGPVSTATGLGIKDHLALARNTPQRRTSSPSPLDTMMTRAHPSPFNLSSSSIGSTLPDFTRARIRDHIFREERLAQVQLAKWASDLQRNIRKERDEYARLVEGERAKWLLERVGEEASLGRIGSFSDFDASQDGDGTASWALGRKERKSLGDGMELPSWARSGAHRQAGLMDARDPLGLCLLGDGVARTGNVVLKVLGGGVLVGAVWMAVCRAWGVDPDRWWNPAAWW